MACGKSTLGNALDAMLPAVRFVDLDAMIEHRAGMSIADIFEREGEEAFRSLETEALRLAAQPGTIIACGGGTPCRRENMDFMLAAGTVVWLRTDTATTVRRLLLAPEGQRPILARYPRDPETLARAVEELELKRLPHYSRAHHTFDSSRLETAGQIDASAHQFIGQFIDTDNGCTPTP